MLAASKLRSYLTHERFNFISTALTLGWYTDGRFTVRLPPEELERLKLKPQDGPVADIDTLIARYSAYRWLPTEKETEVKSAKVKLMGLSLGDKEAFIKFHKNAHYYVKTQVTYCEALHPDILWHRIQSPKPNPIAGFVKNKIVALIMPISEKHL